MYLGYFINESYLELFLKLIDLQISKCLCMYYGITVENESKSKVIPPEIVFYSIDHIQFTVSTNEGFNSYS